MNTKSPFAQWLDEQMLRHGLSGKDLAKIIQVSEATVSRVRRGKIPMSARMRAQLAAALKMECKDIPEIEQPSVYSSGSDHLPTLHILRSVIPDHALLNFAQEDGVFARNGLDIMVLENADAGRNFPTGYASAINENLEKGKFLLVMGPGSTLSDVGVTPAASLFSHTYNGYAFITRATAGVTALSSAPPQKRIFALKSMLEHFENFGIWRSCTLDRFSWLSEKDYDFISAVKGLTSEILTGQKYHPRADRLAPAKNGIDCLHDIGDYGADIAVADADSLGRAYAQSDRFSVVLTKSELEKTIQSINEKNPPGWAPLLRDAYQADKTETAIVRFKAFWQLTLSQLDAAIEWHIFAPDDAYAPTIKLLIQALSHVKNDLDKIMSMPRQNVQVLNWVKDFIEQHAAYDGNPPDKDGFVRAWRNSYAGL